MLFRFYGTEVRSRELLSGNYPPPDEAYTLYKALENQEKRNLMTLESVGKTVKRLGSISGGKLHAISLLDHYNMTLSRSSMCLKW